MDKLKKGEGKVTAADLEITPANQRVLLGCADVADKAHPEV
jgi:hypothetical protein